ncbi:histone-lysine N-methyltransferase SETMAR-like [Linepithema humile]|uniref:histone-lysine N-methyltransferase SETMAR-like n=1 Tax=Linepithema humile TaxID=83485 RepID=UPI00351E0D66
MEKEQYRSMIRFLFLDGKTCEEIKVKLHVVYKDHAPSMITIRYWFNEFKRGRTSVFDEERPGRPIEMDPQQLCIQWNYFRVMYEKDHTIPGKVRLCPKITANHIYLTSSAKMMKVCLAVQLIESSLKKLDEWETYFKNGNLPESSFLTRQTAEGLRTTLRSTLNLVTYLSSIGFESVLSGKINQDALEVWPNFNL